MPNLSSILPPNNIVTSENEATLTNKTIDSPVITVNGQPGGPRQPLVFDQNGDVTFGNGDSFSIPAGGTGERPGNPNTGELRFNTDEGSLEQYDGTNWVSVVPDDIDLNSISINGTEVVDSSGNVDTSSVSIGGTEVIDSSGNVDTGSVSINGTLLTDGESIRVPSGTTGERPASPVTGELRFNTDEGSFEKYDGSSWSSLVPSDIDVNTLSINGTQVIDSTGAGSFTDLDQIVKKPEIISPTANETDVDFEGLTIEGGGYNAVFGGSRDYREFQVDLATGDFSTPVISQQVNADSLTLTTDLADNTQHKVRIRDVDLNGTVSPFSDVVNFTTAVDPLANPTLGVAVAGGFYMGRICAAGTCYNLIVAPNATGCACCQFKTSETSTSGMCSRSDGFANTYPALENLTHPAGNWTATRTIDGFSDWYLPAIDELELFYNNGGGNGAGDPLPSGEDFATDDFYWSSTEGSSDSACYLCFSNNYGRLNGTSKVRTCRVRAVRRVPI